MDLRLLFHRMVHIIYVFLITWNDTHSISFIIHGIMLDISLNGTYNICVSLLLGMILS